MKSIILKCLVENSHRENLICLGGSLFMRNSTATDHFWLTKNGLLWRNSCIFDYDERIELDFIFSNDNLTLRFGPILSSVSFSKYFVINLETDCYFFFCPCSAQIGSFSSLLPFFILSHFWSQEHATLFHLASMPISNLTQLLWEDERFNSTQIFYL